jgi:hypothetical protein
MATKAVTMKPLHVEVKQERKELLGHMIDLKYQSSFVRKF